MNKSINLKPYTTICNMSVYVKRGRTCEYILVAKIKGGYEIIIGRRTLRIGGGKNRYGKSGN